MSECVQLVKRSPMVAFTVLNPPPRFIPYNFTAVANQTEFVLDVQPACVMMLAINGTVQNQEAGDFTVDGDTITLNAGVDAGDAVYGVIQL